MKQQNQINILYMSIEGNTRSFLNRLCRFADQQHARNADEPSISIKEITDQTDLADERVEYFTFVPTYLTGGNGISTGITEIMTNSLGEYIDYNQNASLCVGVIGSGNRNFNEQYCLTARRYSDQFDCPFLDDYELRGTSDDIDRIYNTLVKEVNKRHEKPEN